MVFWGWRNIETLLIQFIIFMINLIHFPLNEMILLDHWYSHSLMICWHLLNQNGSWPTTLSFLTALASSESWCHLHCILVDKWCFFSVPSWEPTSPPMGDDPTIRFFFRMSGLRFHPLDLSQRGWNSVQIWLTNFTLRSLDWKVIRVVESHAGAGWTTWNLRRDLTEAVRKRDAQHLGLQGVEVSYGQNC